jgi:hypothetical protein
MELLVHINKRIKNNPRIQLPVEALLLQYQAALPSPNFFLEPEPQFLWVASSSSGTGSV